MLASFGGGWLEWTSQIQFPTTTKTGFPLYNLDIGNAWIKRDRAFA